MRQLKEPVLWTNLLFVVNAALWALVGFPYTSVLVLLTAAASYIYHLLHERNRLAHIVDMAFAYTALVWTSIVVVDFLTGVHLFALAICLFFGLVFKRLAHLKTYESYHTYWHWCVFFGQALLALSTTTFLS